MASFGDMQAAVSQDLLDDNNTAIPLARVSLAINDAVQYWKFRRFWFNTRRAQITIPQGALTLTLPSDFLVPVTDDGAFQINYSGMTYLIEKLEQTLFDATVLTNGYGRPVYYANEAGSIAIYPIPDQQYLATSLYIKDYTPLVNAGDTNDFSVYAPRLIQYWALANLYRSPRQDPQMSEAFFSSAQDEYQNLQIMNAKSNGTGGITLHSLL